MFRAIEVPSGPASPYAGSGARRMNCEQCALSGAEPTGIPPDIGPRFFFARMATEQSGYRHLRFAAEPVPVLLAPRDARKNAKGPDAVMTNDEKTALLLGAIYRLCEGDVSKFLQPEPVSGKIESFLDSGPSMGARRAALVVILQSIINDQS